VFALGFIHGLSSTLPQDDPTLVLKKHGGWALGKTAPLLTKKAGTANCRHPNQSIRGTEKETVGNSGKSRFVC